MKFRIALTGAVCALAAAGASAQQQELRIGYLVTLSGPTAGIGVDVVKGWKLGLEHEGWTKDGDKLGGVPMRMFYGDDQLKPDVGVKEIDKFIKQDKVHIVAGFQWSHVMLPAVPLLTNAKTVMMSNVAGATPLAGKGCTPYFISTSWNNDQTAQVSGTLLNEDGIKTVYLAAPNIQAGKDVVNGFRAVYKGKEIGSTLFKSGESDFQADISKIRAAKPEAVFLFAPGSMGIAFMKQWAASGANKEIKLYTLFVVDSMSLPVVGEAAIGTFHTNYWDITSDRPANQRFVKEFLAKNGTMPSHFAAQAYDGPRLIAAALKATGGKFDDPVAFVKAMRHTRYESIRGAYAYNVNGFPIQNFYKREVVKGPDGKPQIVTRGVVYKDHKDPYWEECPAANRL
ncbi:MAG: ABC transporter substrate-binding protein [Candidatus Odyssella sp.]|nr:ABC transporter substrate-binding protein [Candidatus Odyssella sp.]